MGTLAQLLKEMYWKLSTWSKNTSKPINKPDKHLQFLIFSDSNLSEKTLSIFSAFSFSFQLST